MPTYDYACADCGEFDALRALGERNDPCACPWCGAVAQRIFVHAPRLACTTPEQRRATEVNERARHAPRSSRDVDPGSYGRLRHPQKCSCCAPQGKTKTAARDDGGMKTQLGRRPWMISH
ncbi:zinc ribbon domain-containing protein [Comamonas odontotermitis]|uniref:FmdB family zinc ribbon protein n=1 Tax=Comamonas odontotermitis TaxID=379895 RepID=UPI003670AE74